MLGSPVQSGRQEGRRSPRLSAPVPLNRRWVTRRSRGRRELLRRWSGEIASRSSVTQDALKRATYCQGMPPRSRKENEWRSTS
jgi:hypothetical protein